MIEVTITDTVVCIAFWLAVIKWMAVLVQTPLFDISGVPNIVKVLASFVITYAFFDGIKAPILADIAFVGRDHFWLLTLIYTLTGLLVGFFLQQMMNVAIVAGQLISQNIGLTMARYFDPTFNEQSGPIEVYVRWVLVMLVLSSGALLPMFKGIYASFFSLSFVALVNSHYTVDLFTSFLQELFNASLILAIPIILIQILVNIALGVISRIMPQMNILVVSFIVNIGVGMLVLLMISDEIFLTGMEIYQSFLAKWFQFLTHT